MESLKPSLRSAGAMAMQAILKTLASIMRMIDKVSRKSLMFVSLISQRILLLHKKINK